MSTKMPARIKPFFSMESPNETVELLDSVDVSIKQGEKLLGTAILQVFQNWTPSIPRWKLTNANFSFFSLGDSVEILANEFNAMAVPEKISSESASGFFNDSVDCGGDNKLNRVTIHIPNYPGFLGHKTGKDTTTEGPKTSSESWSEISLECDDWLVRLQPIENHFAQYGKLKSSKSILLTGVGEITKKNGGTFTRKSVQQVLDTLHLFLSFSIARWVPPLFPVGSSATCEKSWIQFNRLQPTPGYALLGWITEFEGPSLAKVFPTFFKFRNDDLWKEPIELTTHWLVEAVNHTGLEGAIAISQIPLEMIGSLIYLDAEGILTESDYKSINAASKIRLLLDRFDLPLKVPSKFQALVRLVENSTEYKDAPDILVKIRNTIVHPSSKNRNELTKLFENNGVNPSNVRSEARALLIGYVTMVFLRLLGYREKVSECVDFSN